MMLGAEAHKKLSKEMRDAKTVFFLRPFANPAVPVSLYVLLFEISIASFPVT